MKHVTLLLSAATLVAASSASATAITQSTNATSSQPTWNNQVPWGGTAPTAENTYQTASNLASASNPSLGINTTGTLRDNGTTFAGDSLTVVSGSDLLLKQNNGQTSTADLILNGGGIVRLAPDSGGNGELAGTLAIAGTAGNASVLGVVQGSATNFTVSSTVTGNSASVLRLAAGQGASNTITFNGDLSGYAGTFSVGGGGQAVTLNFSNASAFNFSQGTLSFGSFSTADKLNLTNDLRVGSFTFGATTLIAGTYTAAQLNNSYGNGSQFQGIGSLIVVPEPGTYGLMGAGALATVAFVRRRRKNAVAA